MKHSFRVRAVGGQGRSSPASFGPSPPSWWCRPSSCAPCELCCRAGHVWGEVSQVDVGGQRANGFEKGFGCIEMQEEWLFQTYGGPTQ